MRYVLVIGAILGFLGCVHAQPSFDVEHEKLLDFGMANSKKIELLDPKSEAKTYVIVTYLNPIKHELVTQESEKFIVGTYVATGAPTASKVTLANFEVNHLPKEEIKVSVLPHGHPLLKLISSANPWTEYLLVEAPKTEQIDMNISFENDQATRLFVKFQKDY